MRPDERVGPAPGATGTDDLDEALRVSEAAARAGVNARVAGGVGIALLCPSAGRPPLRRGYQDIDMVIASAQRSRFEEVLIDGLGYRPEVEFNSLYGQHRIFFNHQQSHRTLDVFIDGIAGCHRLDLRDRMDIGGPSLTAADLLLSKLQVIRTTDKDMTDAIAILADFEFSDDDSAVSRARLAELCGHDWGWWRTVTTVTERIATKARQLAEEDSSLTQVPGRLEDLGTQLEVMPKSRRWRLRARVGEKVKWYEEPEEIEHEG